MAFRVATMMMGAVAALVMSAPTDAALIVTVQQVGANVVVGGAGSLDLSALTFQGPAGGPGNVDPTRGGIFISTFNAAFAAYTGIGPAMAFGPGDFTLADSHSGDTFAVIGIADQGGPLLYVPTGYVSGAQLAGTDTYLDTTIQSLGFTPGSYQFSWGGREGSADTFTVNVLAAVPEPATWAMMIGGFGLIGGALRRRRNLGTTVTYA